MFQVFHADVAKVDRDVAYIAMIIHVCCKCLFLMFHLFFRRMLQVYLSGYCICLQLFFKCFYVCFACALGACFECFSSFVHMLQLFYFDVSKLVEVVCMLQFEPLATAACCSCLGAAHGREWRSRRRGARKQGSVGTGEWARPGPALACSKRAGAGSKGNGAGGPHQCISRHGRSDAGDPSGRPDTRAANFFFLFQGANCTSVSEYHSLL
jgi:hypothetical protein